MADDEVTNSLLEEYSIADVNAENADGTEIPVEEVCCRSLKDAFSRYAKVIFHDIADSYPTDADVQCFFSLTHGMKHKDGDVVGLFRLGWRSLSEMILSRNVPKPTLENQQDFEIQFRASDLPKDEGEIYQMCYISENEVWGASVPFEFRRATAEELLVVDSGDLVIVRSQSAVVEDLKCQLATMRKDAIAAEANNAEAGRQLTELKEENELLRKRLEDMEKIEKVLERSRIENQALDTSRNASEAALHESQLQIESLNSLVESLKKDVDILQKLVSSQSQELKKIKEPSSLHRGYSQDIVDALRDGKDLAVREMRSTLVENEKLQQRLYKATEENAILLKKVDDLLKVNQTAVENHERCESDYKRRIEELLVQLTQLTSNTQRRLLEARAKNEAAVSSVDLSVLQSHLDCIKNRCNEVILEMQEIYKELEGLQETKTTLLEKQSMLEKRITALQDNINDAQDCNETHQAYSYEKELKMTELKLKEKSVCIESVCQRRGELEKQLRDLRLEMTSLDGQEAETSATIAKLSHTTTYNESFVETSEKKAKKGDCELIHEGASCSRVPGALNGEASREIADLQERLRQAADAYKILYQEKLIVERQLIREKHYQLDNM